MIYIVIIHIYEDTQIIVKKKTVSRRKAPQRTASSQQPLMSLGKGVRAVRMRRMNLSLFARGRHPPRVATHQARWRPNNVFSKYEEAGKVCILLPRRGTLGGGQMPISSCIYITCPSYVVTTHNVCMCRRSSYGIIS